MANTEIVLDPNNSYKEVVVICLPWWLIYKLEGYHANRTTY